MNTFAKVGRIALSHLFSKKVIFGTTRYEDMGMVNVGARSVTTSSEPVILEKEYLGCVSNAYGRQNHYKIFLWSVEIGLSEIILIPNHNEGRLIDLISRFAEGPITHIIIAEKKSWQDIDSVDWELGRNTDDAPWHSGEEVIIYSLTEEQKQSIANYIHNEELDQFESDEEFTFKHGYFPKKQQI
ncbi:hypothetical protein IT401_01085 [Candidatus Nomurabacteria bacterium]|nr:hypothetical protein [Candidatus Nomurabacteria bacterium]